MGLLTFVYIFASRRGVKARLRSRLPFEYLAFHMWYMPNEYPCVVLLKDSRRTFCMISGIRHLACNGEQLHIHERRDVRLTCLSPVAELEFYLSQISLSLSSATNFSAGMCEERFQPCAFRPSSMATSDQSVACRHHTALGASTLSSSVVICST